MEQEGILQNVFKQLGRGAAVAGKALASTVDFVNEGIDLAVYRDEPVFTDDKLKNLEILKKRKEAGELTVISAEEIKNLLG